MRSVGSDAASSFWEYSQTLYQRPGVEAVMLTLQDEYDADVNVVLYCLYIGERLGRCFMPDDLSRITRAVDPWNETVIRPLRSLRRAMRPLTSDPDAAAIRGEIKRIELAAERVAQQRIAETMLAGASAPDATRRNLRLYLGDAADGLLDSLINSVRAGEPQ